MREAAAEWLVELQGADVSVERISNWQRWLAADERHRRAFEAMESTWSAVDQVPVASWPRASEVAADEYDAAVSVAQWRERGSMAPSSCAAATVNESRPREFARGLAGAHGQQRPVTRSAASMAHGAASVAHGVAPLAHGTAPVAQGGASMARGAGSRRLANRWMLAAAVVVALLLGSLVVRDVWQRDSAPALVAQTATGERRTLQLEDGSMIAIGGHSTVQVVLSARSREVRLDAGEAFFEVAKDAQRPFIVHVGDTTVRALGTAFNVRRAADRAVVAVAEGAVQVGNTRLVPGEQVMVDSGGTLRERRSVDAGAVGGWRAGRLQYVNEPLGVVVADVRRYSSREIEIADDAVGALRMTGTVFEDDVDAWLSTVERALPVTIQRDANGRVTLRSARMIAPR